MPPLEEKPSFKPLAKYQPTAHLPKQEAYKSEKSIETSIREYLDTVPGLLHWKDGQFSRPDRIVCYLGLLVGLEIKSTTGKATTGQQAFIKRIREAGGVARVVRTVDEVRTLIEDLKRRAMPRHLKLRSSLSVTVDNAQIRFSEEDGRVVIDGQEYAQALMPIAELNNDA